MFCLLSHMLMRNQLPCWWKGWSQYPLRLHDLHRRKSDNITGSYIFTLKKLRQWPVWALVIRHCFPLWGHSPGSTRGNGPRVCVSICPWRMRETGGCKKDGRHRASPQRPIDIAGNLALCGVHIESGEDGCTAAWMDEDTPARHTQYRVKCYF